MIPVFIKILQKVDILAFLFVPVVQGSEIKTDEILIIVQRMLSVKSMFFVRIWLASPGATVTFLT